MRPSRVGLLILSPALALELLDSCPTDQPSQLGMTPALEPTRLDEADQPLPGHLEQDGSGRSGQLPLFPSVLCHRFLPCVGRCVVAREE